MLSRVANSVYWMSRYLERAENIARFIDVNLHHLLDGSSETKTQWKPLVDATGESDYFERHYPQANQKSVLHFLTLDPDYPNSIVSCVKAARENARSVREIISTEMWGQVNRFFLCLNDPNFLQNLEQRPHEFYEDVKNHCQLFTGLLEGTMSHGEAWHFVNLGRMLERADKTTRILDVKYFILLPGVEYVGTAYDNLQWATLLKSLGALEMYRKQYQHINPGNVANFLIFNENFPRAIHYCIMQAESSLRCIAGPHLHGQRTSAELLLGRLRADLEFSNIEEVISFGLHQHLDSLQAWLNEIGEAIHETFFAKKIFFENQHGGMGQ